MWCWDRLTGLAQPTDRGVPVGGEGANLDVDQVVDAEGGVPEAAAAEDAEQAGKGVAGGSGAGAALLEGRHGLAGQQGQVRRGGRHRQLCQLVQEAVPAPARQRAHFLLPTDSDVTRNDAVSSTHE